MVSSEPRDRSLLVERRTPLIPEKGPYVIGIDAGGTKTEIRLLSPHQLTLAVFRGPGFNAARHEPKILIQTLREALTTFESEHRITEIQALCVGCAGVFHEEEKTRLADALREAFQKIPHVFVLSDAEVAFYTMFGDGPGILLIAGTGSIALGRDVQGNTYRAGGLGLLLDDEGSGSWIGLQAVRTAIRSREKRGPQTLLEQEILGTLSPRAFLEMWKERDAEAYARFFPKVVAFAKAGDAESRRILDEAVQGLLDLVEGVRRQMAWEVREFGYHGGLFREPWFRSRFVEAARARALVPRPLPEDPSLGAAKYALGAVRGHTSV